MDTSEEIDMFLQAVSWQKPGIDRWMAKRRQITEINRVFNDIYWHWLRGDGDRYRNFFIECLLLHEPPRKRNLPLDCEATLTLHRHDKNSSTASYPSPLVTRLRTTRHLPSSRESQP